MSTQNAELDALFSPVGQLATGDPARTGFYPFRDLYIREFLVKELSLLHRGMTTPTRPHAHIIRAVQMACNEDVNQLTDGDFMAVMAQLRHRSFLKVPVRAEYTCMHRVWKDKDNRVVPRMTQAEAKRHGYAQAPCGYHQVETVNNGTTDVYQLEPEDVFIKHDKIDYPRVGTLTDYYDDISKRPHMKYVGDLARWVKCGKSYQSKLAYLLAQPDMTLFQEIEKIKTKHFHGVTESVRLRCGKCGHVMVHESSPSMLNFFVDNTDKDVYNMIYNITSQFGTHVDLNTPVRLFLHLHSTLAADRAKQEQERKDRASRQPILGTPRKRQ